MALEEEAQICRLCGQCESIYIDVFGEEGTKRYLGRKIHTKINILVSEFPVHIVIPVKTSRSSDVLSCPLARLRASPTWTEWVLTNRQLFTNSVTGGNTHESFPLCPRFHSIISTIAVRRFGDI